MRLYAAIVLCVPCRAQGPACRTGKMHMRQTALPLAGMHVLCMQNLSHAKSLVQLIYCAHYTTVLAHCHHTCGQLGCPKRFRCASGIAKAGIGAALRVTLLLSHAGNGRNVPASHSGIGRRIPSQGHAAVRRTMAYRKAIPAAGAARDTAAVPEHPGETHSRTAIAGRACMAAARAYGAAMQCGMQPRRLRAQRLRAGHVALLR